MQIEKYTFNNYKNSLLTTNLFSFGNPLNTKEIKELGHEMIKVAEEEGGCGLAANQVGIKSPLIVVRGKKLNTKYKWDIIYRPKIVREFGPIISKTEMCLSFPGIKVDVVRHNNVHFVAQDKQYWYTGDMARCFFHEYDHICGITILDKMTHSSNNQGVTAHVSQK